MKSQKLTGIGQIVKNLNNRICSYLAYKETANYYNMYFIGIFTLATVFSKPDKK